MTGSRIVVRLVDGTTNAVLVEDQRYETAGELTFKDLDSVKDSGKEFATIAEAREALDEWARLNNAEDIVDEGLAKADIFMTSAHTGMFV